VHGEIVYVFADPATQTSRPIPEVLRSWMQAFEAGEDMVSVQCGAWAEIGTDAAPVRHSVFVEEQGVPADIERDPLDAGARHVVARNRLGQAVGAGRLVDVDGRCGKIGRMAVLPTVRGAAVGRAMLTALVDEARRAGLQEVVLHAQSPVVGFYQRQGFEVCSAAFEEAGIEHLKMRRSVA
jgi:predicted GNAT family N-acyltransferase